MQLPGRLRATTLGDLLGALYRAGASGTLELVEDRGRTHRVHLAQGLVTAVEIDGASPPLAEILKTNGALDDGTLRRALLRALTSQRLVGEVLSKDFHVSPDVIDGAIRDQLVLRLRALEAIDDARVHFRVTVRPPREALRDRPLQASEFLRGRRRARDKFAQTPTPTPPEPSRSRGSAPRAPLDSDFYADAPKSSAYTLLGVQRDADAAEIRRAFRRLARELHPDRHPEASESERRALAVKFAQVAAAYQALVA